MIGAAQRAQSFGANGLLPGTLPVASFEAIAAADRAAVAEEAQALLGSLAPETARRDVQFARRDRAVTEPVRMCWTIAPSLTRNLP